MLSRTRHAKQAHHGTARTPERDGDERGDEPIQHEYAGHGEPDLLAAQIAAAEGRVRQPGLVNLGAGRILVAVRVGPEAALG